MRNLITIESKLKNAFHDKWCSCLQDGLTLSMVWLNDNAKQMKLQSPARPLQWTTHLLLVSSMFLHKVCSFSTKWRSNCRKSDDKKKRKQIWKAHTRKIPTKQLNRPRFVYLICASFVPFWLSFNPFSLKILFLYSLSFLLPSPFCSFRLTILMMFSPQFVHLLRYWVGDQLFWRLFDLISFTTLIKF